MNKCCRCLVWLWCFLPSVSHASLFSASEGDANRTNEFTVVVRSAVPLTALALSPDHQFLLGASAAGVEYWKWPTLQHSRRMETKIEVVQDLQFSPNGLQLAVVGGIPGETGSIEYWDWPRQEMTSEISGHADTIMQAAWSADGHQLATASFDGTCGLWNHANGELVKSFQGHSKPVLAVCFWSPNQLLSAGVDHTIRLWQGSTGENQRTFDNHQGIVSAVLAEPGTKAPRARRLVSLGEDKTVRLWQPEIGRLIRFARLPSVPSTATWDSASDSILIGCEDGTLYRLQQDSLEISAQAHPGVGTIHAIVVHPTTKQVIVAGQDGIAVDGVSSAPGRFVETDGLKGRRPNIIFFLTDDQGYGDLSAHGNPILKTPNLDQLHSRSIRFTNFQVSPTCAPTRSALLTGRHEFRNGVSHTIHERERLTLEATTIAELLQSAGYKTGVFGKWHLGDEDEYLPNRRGFDEVFIHGAGGIGQVYPGSCGDAPGNTYFNPLIWHNRQFVKTEGYCTDVFYGRAIEWIEEQHHAGRPFFAYVPSNAPHDPFHAKPEDAALYESTAPNNNVAHFFGMLHNIDTNVAAVVSKLQELGIEDETLLIFMNDNGTSAGQKVFNASMRGAKGTPWVGGTRAISFWSWPGTLTPADCSTLSAHIDVFPTLAELAGVEIHEDVRRQVEGRSLVPLLQDPKQTFPDRFLVTHVGRWPKFAAPDQFKYRGAAIRNTRWSLVSAQGAAQPQWELFDLQTDFGQQTNVAGEHPEVVEELSDEFERWWAGVQSGLCNEAVVGPDLNPFAVRYWRQFGGEPSEEDRRRMAPPQPPQPSRK
ncbi:MAG: sulfatase-like hydrolase/transferase [Planctomycetaceae bacterium]|nr:sulfatase-like hydrolase/transferase [Planctomycetaceae bacterium]